MNFVKVTKTRRDPVRFMSLAILHEFHRPVARLFKPVRQSNTRWQHLFVSNGQTELLALTISDSVIVFYSQVSLYLLKFRRDRTEAFKIF